ncbi:MAG TPA: adenylate/guanylate cyclase domain-containing protein [Gaiellaceae bacterium]|nr:adenylate/guanylate cyclase domain-containing protein [Gaiellaceae bacterium]
MRAPEVRYAKTVDGVHIAYLVRGSGPVDLVYTLGMAGNFEIEFEPPWGVRFLERLASFSRVILFDKRGTGLSDRVLGVPDFDMRADDLGAVLDGAGSERAVLVGNRGGGSLAAFYAAMHPDRVLALVLYNSWARTAWAPDYPFGSSKEELAAWREEIAANWGTREMAKRFLESVAPSHADDPEWIRWEARSLRHGASPAAALAFDEFEQAIDVRRVLHTVQAPTLVLSRSEAARARSADLAERIPGARHVHVPGEEWMPYAGDIDVLLGEIERFVRSVSAEQATFERVLTTVLFTDVVGSTQRVAELGDGAWKTLVERHHALVRAMIGRYRGTEVDTAGDGFFGTFDGPARAVRCAKAIIEAVRPMGIDVRAGVHTGEVEIIDEKVGGIAVSIGARVAALAAPAEVLVSQTVKDLTTGSGLVFAEAGEHELKGVPERWRLYRVVV